MAKLNVVCLISGGKDSLFSILHCLQNGHDVVALANVHPPLSEEQDATEELDSYMYQTVGHKVIPLYEKALRLPLYRQQITGTAVNQSKSYGCETADAAESADETESLVPLLQKVKRYHPQLNAISTGAILSDYQRTRVESVAIRLGLTPLSYLWQWPNLPPHSQSTLLEDMHAVGQDSRIIKVASGGLDSSFLWLNVADPRTIRRLERAVLRFGSGEDGAVLGEGGEYETLAIAGPAPLWKGSVEVTEDQLSALAGEAGSASVSISHATTLERDDAQDFAGVRMPVLLEPQYGALLQDLNQVSATQMVEHESAEDFGRGFCDHVCYQQITGPSGKSTAEQMAAIMNKKSWSTLLQLQSPPLEYDAIAYVSIILREMGDFAAMNSAYSAAFSKPNPPARITLAEPSVLPEGKDVMVTFTCARGASDSRTGLHVQSQSYWAPANIGPYSQAISVPANSEHGEEAQRVVYIAGQIPLVPASMDLASPAAASGDLEAFMRQAVLAAQHFVRIGRVMQVKRWACGIAFIMATSDEDAKAKSNIAHKTWCWLHRSPAQAGAHPSETDEAEEDDFDVWDMKHGIQRSVPSAQNHSNDTFYGPGKPPPLRVIQVKALPRNASIEWAVHGLTAQGGSTPRIPQVEHLLEVFKHRIVR